MGKDEGDENLAIETTQTWTQLRAAIKSARYETNVTTRSV